MDPVTTTIIAGVVSSSIAGLIVLFVDRVMFHKKQKDAQHPVHLHTTYQTVAPEAMHKSSLEWIRLSGAVKLLLAICLPPLAIYLHKGANKTLWVNIGLTLLWFWPGVCHALLILYGKPIAK